MRRTFIKTPYNRLKSIAKVRIYQLMNNVVVMEGCGAGRCRPVRAINTIYTRVEDLKGEHSTKHLQTVEQRHDWVSATLNQLQKRARQLSHKPAIRHIRGLQLSVTKEWSRLDNAAHKLSKLYNKIQPIYDNLAAKHAIHALALRQIKRSQR